MTTIEHIETTLRAQLPADLHARIPALAQILAHLSDVSLLPEEARQRLADPTFTEILRALVGQQLPLAGGDYIEVGNISQAKGVAVGAGAVAIGDIVIHINTLPVASDMMRWPSG